MVEFLIRIMGFWNPWNKNPWNSCNQKDFASGVGQCYKKKNFCELGFPLLPIEFCLAKFYGFCLLFFFKGGEDKFN